MVRKYVKKAKTPPGSPTCVSKIETPSEDTRITDMIDKADFPQLESLFLKTTHIKDLGQIKELDIKKFYMKLMYDDRVMDPIVSVYVLRNHVQSLTNYIHKGATISRRPISTPAVEQIL